jgi:cobalt-zinc-cadmium efflux system outer membrane protein
MDARGAAIQAGVHPNPVIGYEADTVGSSYTRNYQGVFGTQTIKTAGKLGLARAAANMSFMNAEIELRQTRIDVLTQVRANYYAVLVAQESLARDIALERFTTEAFRIQVDKLKAGEGTGYEPAQMRTQVMLARAAVIQSQNRFISAWKQLAASVGILSLPPAPLEGQVDMPMPVLDYETLLARILNNHPDVLQARNLAEQAKLSLQLAQVTPIPDLQLYGTFQRDFTVPGFERTSYNVQMGVPLPVFDRNQGNIVSAQGRLRSMNEQIRVVRNSLSTQFADAFERYQSNRVLADYYHEQILPDLVRAYRGIYERHQQESAEVGFGDIIVAQQNLAVGLGSYLTALGLQWTALTDIAHLLQLDDMRALFQPMPPGPLRPAEQAQPDGPKN